jgi:hypothetical protein
LKYSGLGSFVVLVVAKLFHAIRFPILRIYFPRECVLCLTEKYAERIYVT